MAAVLQLTVSQLIEDAYYDGFSKHGNLGLDLDFFARHSNSIITKHLGPNPLQATAAAFFLRLHTNDLYLSAACAQPTEAAWDRFITLYRRLILHLSQPLFPTRDAASELAGSITGHIFLPDRSGRSRIASFDGRSSLATWLAAVVNHKAIKERERKCNNMESIACAPELTDDLWPDGIEASLRANRYQHMVRELFAQIGKSLSEREHLVLRLHYDEGLSGADIAGILGIHPSTVARDLQRINIKLRGEIISLLGSKHHLSRPEIEECITDMLENPAHSILESLKR
jgi:RNA polymerase sigma-70 factor